MILAELHKRDGAIFFDSDRIYNIGRIVSTGCHLWEIVNIQEILICGYVPTNRYYVELLTL